MRQTIVPGGSIEVLTQDEMVKLISRPSQFTRVRAPGNVILSATGGGDAEVYKVPAGMEFKVRRVVLTMSGNVPNDPNTGNVLLTAAGKFVAYTRSGELIEYGQPQYGAAIQVPGVQTWGSEQGPFLSNGEVFGVVAAGLTPGLSLSVYVEGILKRPSSKSDD